MKTRCARLSLCTEICKIHRDTYAKHVENVETRRKASFFSATFLHLLATHLDKFHTIYIYMAFLARATTNGIIGIWQKKSRKNKILGYNTKMHKKMHTPFGCRTTMRWEFRDMIDIFVGPQYIFRICWEAKMPPRLYRLSIV